MILSQLLFCQEQISAKYDRFGWVNQGSKKKPWVIELSYKTIDFQILIIDWGIGGSVNYKLKNFCLPACVQRKRVERQ
jgi:hypothetical protein